jgi:formamidopyrimidine-DNA glycosylase
MPELPDITIYREALDARVRGHSLLHVRIINTFLLRTAVPPISDVEGKRAIAVRRVGKQIVLALEGDYFLVLHLMIAGRLRWLDGKARAPARITLATFEFDNGTLAFTEAGTKRRASLHCVRGQAAVAAFDMGGIDVLGVDKEAFASRLLSENHTLKRALSDPRLFSGIGNAYSDEILHRAKLSPLTLTSRLDDAECSRLLDAARGVLTEWTDRLRAEAGDAFPEKVTAFHPEMAVHGKFGQPCPVCGAPVQRIVYAENECNYCARCQNGGIILADRALSRLLHKSWPRSIDR